MLVGSGLGEEASGKDEHNARTNVCMHQLDSALQLIKSSIPVGISGQLLLDPEPLLPNLLREVWLHPLEKENE